MGFFAISLLAQSLIPLFSRAFYATHDTLTPVKIAVVSFVVNIIGCLILGPLIGIGGLALAFSLASFINLILLYYFFHKKALALPNKNLGGSFLRAIGLSLTMLIVIQLSKNLIGSIVDMQTFIGVSIQTITAVISGFLFYFFASLLLHFPEVEMVKQFLKRKQI